MPGCIQVDVVLFLSGPGPVLLSTHRQMQQQAQWHVGDVFGT
jgi:hypothetical protein